MNAAISFLSGCIVFALIFVLKIPVKRLNRVIAESLFKDTVKQYICYKRLNISIFAIIMVTGAFTYAAVIKVLGITHFKWCCTLKSAVIAVALYYIFERIMDATGK